jgi:hypothetical protein
VTSGQLIRWAALHERRARTGGILASPPVIAVLVGGALAGWISWRSGTAPVAASHAWLAGTMVAFGLAFMRVPFHLYWRTDAALLAQLPIPGQALLDAALWRCVRAGATTTLAVMLAAAPLARISGPLAVRHLAIAAVLGLAAMLLMPAVAIAAAALVAAGQSERITALRRAAGIDGATAGARPSNGAAAAPPPAPSTAALGALPGFAATILFALVLLISGWLTGAPATLPAVPVLAALAAVSVLVVLALRASAPPLMGTILRDVSALDRQRLARLEIGPPTALERAIAGTLGDAALAYGKDARLMRRRYPMAFALGAVVFLVLVIVGLARPADPSPWLIAAIGGATVYGLALGGRLRRPPIELARLTAMLPVESAAVRRAKVAWLAGWWTVYVGLPGVFAVLRQPEGWGGLGLVGAGTLLVLGAGLARR